LEGPRSFWQFEGDFYYAPGILGEVPQSSNASRSGILDKTSQAVTERLPSSSDSTSSKPPENIVSVTVPDFTKTFSDNQLRAEEFWKSNQARMNGKVKSVSTSGNTIVVVLEGGGWLSPDFHFEYDQSWKNYASQLHRDQQVQLTGWWQGSSWGRESFKGTGLQW
jgi:hypothetical protein